MKLFEYEAKEILSKYGIPTPTGGLITSPKQARETAERIKSPVVVKAQVLVAGRGKAGGILLASSPAEAELSSSKLLSSKIKGIKVQSVLVEEQLSISKELYFSITVDRSNRSYVAIASSEGGVEIEEIAAATPEKIIKVLVDPLYGFRSYHARQIAKKLGYVGSQMRELAAI
ncbi:acetate--CoA ligase family protein, partial [Candidatus Bathyarchaeota archaeon]|nr:acetate--CoA ligase family protein [Candidatus Bathyarchaeota archaeon]